ncbi:MAG: 50S ribosomal protein L4 [Candidatus Goldiibacteriota bacterium]
MKLDVVDKENKKLEEFEIDEKIMTAKVKDDLLHDIVLMHHTNSHTGSSNSKTRAMVSGGGAKPWRQKGTGRARAGSNRSPIWTGGGITFGPHPRKTRVMINKKTRKKAFAAVIAGKINDGEITVINAYEIDSPKTKAAVDIIKGLGIKEKKILLVAESAACPAVKAARNIQNVTVIAADDVNVYELLNHPRVIITKKSMEKLVRRAG